MSQRRQPRGVRIGGQYAVDTRDDDVELDDPEALIDQLVDDSINQAIGKIRTSSPGADYEPVAWVPVRHEELPWVAHGPLSLVDRNQPTSYRSSVPPPIAEERMRLPQSLLADSERVTAEITRFDSETAHLLPPLSDRSPIRDSPLASLLIRTESSSSSTIEQVTAAAQDVALAETGVSYHHDPHAALIVANSEAMREAFAIDGSPTREDILRIHAALMQAESHAGSVRNQPVWIGGGPLSPVNAAFVPPRADLVDDGLADLEKFIARTDLPTITQCAIAHAQFETIHPFVDGNGRTGRALVHTMMRSRHLTTTMTVPLSAGLLTDTGRYFDALRVYRRGDARPIIEQFHRSSLVAIRSGKELVRDLTAVRSDWKRRIDDRATSTVWPTLDLLMHHPVVNRSRISQATGMSTVTASKVINKLLDAGVIEPVDDKANKRMFKAPQVLDALDGFQRRL